MILRQIDTFNPANPFVHEGICFDPQRGSGSMPMTHEINYFGFVVFLYPSKFIIMAANLRKEHIRKSMHYFVEFLPNMKRCISPSCLMISSKDNEVFSVEGHEGRHRAYAMEELGIDTIPVFVYPTNKRSRHCNQEFLEKFHDKIISEDGFPIVINGNYFIVDTKVYAFGRREADLDDLEKRWIRPQHIETEKKSLADDDGHAYYWSEPVL